MPVVKSGKSRNVAKSPKQAKAKGGEPKTKAGKEKGGAGKKQKVPGAKKIQTQDLLFLAAVGCNAFSRYAYCRLARST